MLVIDLYIRIILILGAFVLTLSIFLVIERYRYFRRTAIEKSAFDRLQPLVLDFTSNEDISFGEFKASMDRKSDLPFLKTILMNYISRMQGSSKNRLMLAYMEFRFLELDLKDINSRRWWVQARGARSIGLLQLPEASKYLTPLMDSPNLDVRLMTGYALGRLGDRRAVRMLLKEAAENNKWIRIRLYELIENMRDKALSELTSALTESDRPEEIALCIEVLGHAKDEVAAPTILMLINHPSMEVRVKAVKALAEIKYLPALDALLDLLDDEQWEVRALASKALDSLGEVSAVERLSEMLGDSQWWVRYNAAVALSHLKGAGVRKLADTVRNNPDKFARDIARQALEELAYS